MKRITIITDELDPDLMFDLDFVLTNYNFQLSSVDDMPNRHEVTYNKFERRSK